MSLRLPCKLAAVSTFFALLFAWGSFGQAIFAADTAPGGATVIRVDTTQVRHTMAKGIAPPPASLHAANEPAVVHDAAMEPASIVLSPSPQDIPPTKRQGVPGIERTTKGRLWAISEQAHRPLQW